MTCCSLVPVHTVVGGFTSVSVACKMVPSAISYNSLRQTEGNYYFSVNLSADGHVICGMNGKAEVWDPDKSEIKYSASVESHMNDTFDLFDMKEYGDHLYGAWKHDDQLTVVRYDRQLTNREDVISIPYQTDNLSHIDVRYGNIAINDWDNKLIKLYTTDGEFLRDIQLKDAIHPWGVRLMKDNCVLVSDCDADSVTKYRTDGSGEIVWRFDDRLQSSAGLCVDEWGLVFVACNTADKIYLLSPQGN